MTDAKIEITIGTIFFQAEGDQEWVAEQLDKLFSNAKDLAAVAPALKAVESGIDHTPIQHDSDIGEKPLATFLKEKNAEKNQSRKFIATALWLESKGKNRLSTSDIANALKTSYQTKINNPSDCLNKHIKKGHCEKDGNLFFVTTEGKKSL